MSIWFCEDKRIKRENLYYPIYWRLGFSMKSHLINTLLAVYVVYVGVVNYYDPDRGFGEVAYERKTAMFTFSAIIPVEENRVLTRGQEVQCDVSDKGVVLWIKKTEHRKW